ncbi:hypothetical protein AMAG_00703 [Allomyces macrogynus ATCC 38327]|uniref:BHLH domain-containing protein n=1 Tax=Allomyces macrogynus (strain ATCC 38327) TaxID=578462 RepID=A0A0L0RX88_ALLM3|nr:hypothetical protein AMAG_00703 [Allomyces macrogynus ATCC 38327]|eukprot:KNE54744.1 hypothetical protein AMAG_00703 [Allomyces macrogynus ATCC 38327]
MTGALHTDPDDARDHGPPPRPSSAASAASAAALHQQQQYAAAAAAAAAMANPFAAAAAMYSMSPAAAAMAAASNPLAMMAGGAMNPFMPRFGMVDDAMTTAAAMASWGHMPYNPAAAAAAAAAASGMAGMPGMGLAGMGPNPAAFLNAMAASTPPEPVQRPRSTRATTDAAPGFDDAVDAANSDIKRAPPLHCPVPVVATLAAPTPPMSSPIHARFPPTDPFSQWSSSAPVPPLHHAPSRARSTALPADTMPESAQEKERRKTKEAKRRQDVKSRVQRLCTMIGAPVSGAYNASTLDAVIVHMQQLHTTIDELYSMKSILEEQGVDCNTALARARRERNGSASPPKQPSTTTAHDYVAEDPCRSESKRPSSKSRPRPTQPSVTAVATPQKENIPPSPARPHTPPAAYPRVTTAEDMAALLTMDQTAHPSPYVAAPTPAPATLPSTTSATLATMASAPGNSLKARSVLARAAAAPYPTRPTPSRRASTLVLAKPDTPAAVAAPSWTPSRLPRQPYETPAAPTPGRVPLSATKRVSPQSQRAVHEASPSKAVTLEIADDGTPFFAGTAAAAATAAPMDDLDQMMASVLDPGLRMALLGDMPPPPPAMMPPHGNTLSLDDELSQILEMADAAAATPRTRLMPEMSPPASDAVRSSPLVLDEQRGEYEHPATDDDLDGEWGADAHGDDEAPGLLELTPVAAEHGHSDAPSGAEYGGGGDEAAQYQYEEEVEDCQHQWTDETMQFQEFLVDGHDDA